MAVPTKLISTSQAFQDAKGNVVANGFLMLQLSQNAEVTASGGQVTTQALWLPLDANGKITSTAIWFNDELSPSGTVYYAKLFGSNGMLQIQDFGSWSISGAAADLSTVVPTSPSVGAPGVVFTAPAATQTIVQPTGTSLNVNRFENVRFADQFATGSNTGGIAEAYADLPSTGGVVALGADITISAAQTMSLTTGKPLILNGNGRVLTFTHTTGVGLTITKNPNASPRDHLVIRDLDFKYSGSSASITGLQLGAQGATTVMVNCSVLNCNFNSFGSSGATALFLSNFEDGHVDNCSFNLNTLALKMDVNCNQNCVSNCWWQGNTNAVQATDVQTLSFLNCLIQSNSGQKPFQILASTLSTVNVNIIQCHFENNGDTTNASRHISLNASVGKSVVGTVVEACLFNGGTNFPNGATCIEAIGAGTVTFGRLCHNVYNNGTATSGFAAGKGLTIIGDSAVNYDVGINPPTAAIPWGILFNSVGAAKAWQVYGGVPGQFDGSLVFRDITSSVNILTYGSSTWTMPQGVLQITENGVPGGVASNDVLWADATAHRLKMNNNNTGAALIVGVDGATSQKAETAADTNVLTFTPPALAGTYRIRFDLALSAANAATLGWTATWKDSNGTAKAPTNLSLFQVGTAAPALTFTTSTTDEFYGDVTIDVDNSATAIVVKLTFSGTSFAGKASATIERLI